MEKIREWSFPVALVTAWMGVAAYVLVQVATPAPMPTVNMPEVVITVDASSNPS